MKIVPVQKTGGGLFWDPGNDFFNRPWLEPIDPWNWKLPALPTYTFPKVDIEETPKEYTVKAEIPGIDPNKIEIEVSENSITISGKQQEEKEEKGKQYYRKECYSGSFSRSFGLANPIEPGKVKAEAGKDGVLTVVLPKKKVTRQSKVQVKIK